MWKQNHFQFTLEFPMLHYKSVLQSVCGFIIFFVVFCKLNDQICKCFSKYLIKNNKFMDERITPAKEWIKLKIIVFPLKSIDCSIHNSYKLHYFQWNSLLTLVRSHTSTFVAENLRHLICEEREKKTFAKGNKYIDS